MWGYAQSVRLNTIFEFQIYLHEALETLFRSQYEQMYSFFEKKLLIPEEEIYGETYLKDNDAGSLFL